MQERTSTASREPRNALNAHDRNRSGSSDVMHYLLGMLPGAAYGALRERMPAVATGRGLLYGFTLFAVQDQVVAPALGLARGPRQYPWQVHARGLVTHLIVGLTMDAVLNAAGRVRRR